jgi:tetratricopeptide (TPR) repeat protein
MAITKTEKIWHNGKFIAWDDAKVHVMAHVVNYGSSVFEGIRCYSHASGPGIFRAAEHIKRLLDSAKIYRIDVDYTVEDLVQGMVELVRVNKVWPCYLRPIVLRGYGEAGVTVKARPDDAQLRITYAEYLAAAGKRDEALTELRAVQNVEDPTLLAALGVRFGRLKAFPDCVAALDKAIKLKAAPDLHVRRGVCRHDFGDDAGAQADYDAALKLDANFPPAHYYLGRHLEKKDKKKATESLEKAAKLDPNGPIGKQAKEALEDLKKKK